MTTQTTNKPKVVLKQGYYGTSKVLSYYVFMYNDQGELKHTDQHIFWDHLEGMIAEYIDRGFDVLITKDE